MLKARREAAETVAADFLLAETAADHAALLAASCVATMLKARADARLPVRTGARALQLVGEAASDLLRARQRLIEAHGALAEARDEVGLRGFVAYGDEGDCDLYEQTGRLDARGVPPKLTAVA